jgi:PAS domain S-box-containing protein
MNMLKRYGTLVQVFILILVLLVIVQTLSLYYLLSGAAGGLELNAARSEILTFYQLLLVAFLPLLIYLLSRWLLSPERYMSATGTPAQPGSPAALGAQDEASFFLGTFYEVITKLKEKERELEYCQQVAKQRAAETERFNDEIISSVESALITIDKTGKVRSFNPAAERIFKVDAREVINTSYKSFFLGSPQLLALIENCLRDNVSYKRYELKIVNKNGETRHLGAAISPIKDANEVHRGALCLLSDLTEIIELQERIKLKENLAALGEMSAGIAHEFKNSLATISGYAQLVAKESRSGGSVSEYISILSNEVKSLAQLVNSFGDFTKPSTLNLEPVDLDELVQGCVRDLTTDPNFAHIQVETSGEFQVIKGDRVLLRQALVNILRNAAEALSPGLPERRIHISGRVAPQSDGPYALIQIEDTGPGVSASDLERIFFPFYTTKRQGTGLGLAIAQKIVVNHYGKIVAKRKDEGTGMIFVLSFPM